MNREDIEKLIGGYATETLTAAERDALFAAALEDQQLFDALVREEPLREALQDPSARAELLAALGDAPRPWYYREVHPGIIVAVAAALVIVTLAVKFWPVRTAPPINVVAQSELPQPAKSALPTQLTQQFLSHETPELPEAPVIATQRGAAPDVLGTIDALLPVPSSAGQTAPPSAAVSLTAQRPPTGRCCGPILLQPPPLGLLYTVLKRLPNGELAPVDPRQELDSSDETVVRFEPNESGFLYVLERSGDSWRPIATEQVRSLGSYTVPRDGAFHNEGAGPREFLVLFSLQAQDFPKGAAVVRLIGRPPAPIQQMFGGAASNLVAASAQRPEQVSFSITLKYPSR
jgi:hypothetical protein